MTKVLCVCDQCKHIWLAPEVPERCSNCKSRTWNGTDSTKGKPLDLLSLANQIAESDRQVRETSGKSDIKAETLQNSLCHHGVYKPLCRICKAA